MFTTMYTIGWALAPIILRTSFRLPGKLNCLMYGGSQYNTNKVKEIGCKVVDCIQMGQGPAQPPIQWLPRVK